MSPALVFFILKDFLILQHVFKSRVKTTPVVPNALTQEFLSFPVRYFVEAFSTSYLLVLEYIFLFKTFFLIDLEGRVHKERAVFQLLIHSPNVDKS